MKIAIIGAGNMGGAIARGLSQGKLVAAKDIVCTAHSQETLNKLHDFNADFQLSLDNRAAVQGAEVVFLAVKPWKMEQVVEEIKPHLNGRPIIVSIAAGIPLATLRTWFTDGDRLRPILFRAIPNTAIAVQAGMTFVAGEEGVAAPDEQATVCAFFEAMGATLVVEESTLPAYTALASCGIAFALRYVRASVEGGVALGVPARQGQEVVAQTLMGAARLLLENKSHPEVEIDKVTTPGGITIKGLNEMEHAGFTSAVIRGLEACV